MFSYKIYEQNMLAICDADILGKTFEEGEIKIEIKTSFYHEEICDEKKAIELIKAADNVNACGKRIIEIMLRNNLIDQDKILLIENMPHAQIIKI